MPNVASRYAKALFDSGVAEGGGAERRYGELLDSFVRSLGEIGEFRTVLSSPHVSRDRKKAFLSTIFSDPADERFLRFLFVLLDKGRLETIGLIGLDYKGLLLASQNVLEALVESAFPLDDATIRKIAETFRARTGANEIRATVRVVPDLVGGIRVSIGSAIYDGTARSNLDRLLTSMNTQGFHHGN